MKPLIGMTAYHNMAESTLYLRENYLTSVLSAGGLPVLLPQTADADTLKLYLSQLDAVILTGGGDVAPERYREARKPECGKEDRERDDFELTLTELALEAGLPILGICRGCQVLAVALGGTLIQDIEQETGIPRIAHSQEPPYNRPVHRVLIRPEGLLYRILGKDAIETNSSHHQSVAVPGETMHIDAVSQDGIVEGFSVRGSDRLLGVQFHPEHMAATDPDALKIFQYLVCQARKYHDESQLH